MEATAPQTMSNFGRNEEFVPKSSYQPGSEQDVIEILDKHRGDRIRVTGSLHSWSKAPVCNDVHLDMSRVNTVELNRQNGVHFVTVGAGCQVKHLLDELKQHELTLPSVGLIDEQTIAGATATGTHGSGKHSLSHYIAAVRIAHYDADGEATITEITSGPELQAARCSLGLLGVVISLKFKCRPCYQVKEHLEKYTTLKKLMESEKRFPLQQFYLMPWSWMYYGHHRVESNEPKSKVAFWYHAYWSLFIDIALHIVVTTLAKFLNFKWLIRFFYSWIVPMTIIRNWKVVDDSHKMLVMEHEKFRHIEIELFVTRNHLSAALDHVVDVVAVFGGKDAPSGNRQRAQSMESFKNSYCHHYPICVRRILPDETLISMACPQHADLKHVDAKQDWYAISLISYHRPRRRKGFIDFANFLASSMAERFQARAHWGKYNPLTRQQNQKLYPRLEEFTAIRSRFDPQGNFENDWLSKVLPERTKVKLTSNVR